MSQFGDFAIAATNRPLSSGVLGTGAGTYDLVNRTTYTFASLGIGAASTSRRVVVILVALEAAGGTSTLNSATIGGVAATEHTTTDGSFSVHIISAIVPTGTTADVVATFASAQSHCFCTHYVLNNVAPVPVDVKETSGSAASLSVSINAADAFVIAGGGGGNATTSVSSWTAPMTSNYSARQETTSYGSASLLTRTGSASQTVQINFTASGTCRLGAVAFLSL